MQPEPAYTVFRTSKKRDGTYLIVTREGKSAWAHVDYPEGSRIIVDAGGEAKAAAAWRVA